MGLGAAPCVDWDRDDGTHPRRTRTRPGLPSRACPPTDPPQLTHSIHLHPRTYAQLPPTNQPAIKTTVNGGARVVQTITVKNNGQTTAQALVLTTTPGADLPLIKGRLSIAQAHGTPKPTIASQSGVPTSTTFTIPAGKMLKATLAYKAANCLTLANPHLVNTFVSIPADTNGDCFITPAAGSVRLCLPIYRRGWLLFLLAWLVACLPFDPLFPIPFIHQPQPQHR